MLEKDFLRAMAENMALGIRDGRVEGDWKERDFEGRWDRFDAMGRHMMAYLDTGDRRHFAAIACDAMFCFWYDKEGLL